MPKTPEVNFICDISGFKHPKSQMRKMWNGLYVHKSQWEPRQPQDFVKAVRPPKAVDNARPDAILKFNTQIDRSVL